MSDGVNGVAFAAYRLAGIVAMPLMPAFLLWRARQKKEDRRRLGERRGYPSLARPDGPLVWVHAASVGETNAVMPLVQRLASDATPVLLTTITVTGAQIAMARLPRGAVHQFSPLDISPWVQRFLAHWRPSLALFVESELWPVTMTTLSAAGIPQILVNARLSERSFDRWNRVERFVRPLFSRLALCLAQSPGDAERYRAIGAAHVEVTGNLKFDVPMSLPDESVVAAFKRAIGDRPVWVAASTHEGEEAIAGEVHAALAAQHPGLLTIIVPRHPGRGPDIAEVLAAAGLDVALRSRRDPVFATTDIYIADTLGELSLFYCATPIAFVGGSLVPRGGQNPIEPVRCDAAVLHGPHVANFADVYAALDASGSEVVHNAVELAAGVHRLLADPARARNRVRAAAAALRPFSGALDATLAALRPYLDRAALGATVGGAG